MPWQGSPRAHTVRSCMPSAKEAIGARLLRLRQERGSDGKDLTQHDAASLVGTEARQWQRWETGGNEPRKQTLEHIATTFGIDLAEFYEGVSGGKSQLDRIEARLDDVAKGLEGAAAQALAGDPIQGLEDLVRRLRDEQPPETPGASDAPTGSDQ
jgi:transcriptional regulator with XRE-family HTH domain